MAAWGEVMRASTGSTRGSASAASDEMTAHSTASTRGSAEPHRTAVHAVRLLRGPSVCTTTGTPSPKRTVLRKTGTTQPWRGSRETGSSCSSLAVLMGEAMRVAAKRARKPTTIAAVRSVLIRWVSGRGTPKTSAAIAAGGSNTPHSYSRPVVPRSSWADFATLAVTVATIWSMKTTEMTTAATVPKHCRPTCSGVG